MSTTDGYQMNLFGDTSSTTYSNRLNQLVMIHPEGEKFTYSIDNVSTGIICNTRNEAIRFANKGLVKNLKIQSAAVPIYKTKQGFVPHYPSGGKMCDPPKRTLEEAKQVANSVMNPTTIIVEDREDPWDGLGPQWGRRR